MITERDNKEVEVKRATWFSRHTGQFEPTPYVSLEVEDYGSIPEYGGGVVESELTPTEARALAAELNSVADEIDPQPAPADTISLLRDALQAVIAQRDAYYPSSQPEMDLDDLFSAIDAAEETLEATKEAQ